MREEGGAAGRGKEAVPGDGDGKGPQCPSQVCTPRSVPLLLLSAWNTLGQSLPCKGRWAFIFIYIYIALAKKFIWVFPYLFGQPNNYTYLPILRGQEQVNKYK